MTRPNVLPSAICTASAPRIGIFRGSMAGLCAPLSTLRRNPRGQLRMTRGRCGSLLLHRKRLALSTPCRSPGASQMFSALPPKPDIAQCSRHVRNVPIVLQNSQNAVLPISRKQTKRAEIAERHSLQAVTEVACELWQNNVVPQMIIRSPNIRPGHEVLNSLVIERSAPATSPLYASCDPLCRRVLANVR